MSDIPSPTPPRTAGLTDDLKRLLTRARAGDRSTLPAVRALLEGEWGAALMEAYGDQAAKAAAVLTAAATGEDLLSREALLRKLKALAEEVAGPDASPLERLLAERVALCWLDVHHADVRAALSAGDAARREFCQRRQDRAQARYLAAVKALATLRKLLRPAPSTLEVASRTVEETTGGARTTDFRRLATAVN